MTRAEAKLANSSRRAKAEGAHETPSELALLLAALALGEVELPDSRPLQVLDPACGSGVLLAAVASELRQRVQVPLCLSGFESDVHAIGRAGQRLEGEPGVELQLKQGDFLEAPLVGEPLHDLIVANPPFVRTQVLGSSRAQALARRFGLSGRVDLYQAFVQAMTAALKPGGVLGLIAPNRLLSVRSGATIRRLLESHYELLRLIDLGDTRLFTAAVLPLVLVARRRQAEKLDSNAAKPVCRFTRIYQDRQDKVHGGRAYNSVLTAVQDALVGSCRVADQAYVIETGNFSAPADPSAAWCLTTVRDQQWLDQVEARAAERLGTIGQVRVGIKTTADLVFVRDDWQTLDPALRPESTLLKPLLTHREARRWGRPAVAPSRSVLYTHVLRDGKRQPIELDQFPRASAYLETRRTQLEARSYVQRAGRRWYEIWVPQDPAGWTAPKLVFPDIAEEPRAYLDTTGAVVQGDCYWITLEPGRDPRWLRLALGVLNSSLATAYYDALFHNKLYNGRRRYITQYVARFPLPALDVPSALGVIDRVNELVALASQGRCDESLEAEVDRLVWLAFGLVAPAKS